MLSNMMTLHPAVTNILLRILLSVAAGALIGFNRERGGHAAGFRTTILITLAACTTMIQANLLLGVTGKENGSFAVMDTLRFPLGVLTGVGFIGGGAILRRGDAVTGLTTAATIWTMTAVGLSIGGGQLGVGLATTIVAFVVLSPFKSIDHWLTRELSVRITLYLPADTKSEAVRRRLECLGYNVCHLEMQRLDSGERLTSYLVKFYRSHHTASIERLLEDVEREFTIVDFKSLT